MTQTDRRETASLIFFPGGSEWHTVDLRFDEIDPDTYEMSVREMGRVKKQTKTLELDQSV